MHNKMENGYPCGYESFWPILTLYENKNSLKFDWLNGHNCIEFGLDVLVAGVCIGRDDLSTGTASFPPPQGSVRSYFPHFYYIGVPHPTKGMGLTPNVTLVAILTYQQASHFHSFRTKLSW
jgi:hypothetical protein